MVYEERNTWAGLVVSAIGMTVYVIVILQQAAGGPVTDVVWWPIMLWTIGLSIVAVIVISILWGILAGMRATPPASAPRTSAIATSHGWAAGSARRSW